MNIITELKTTWSDIPSEMRSFLKRALIIFIIWKLCYHLFLFPGRKIDAPLTHVTSSVAAWTMQKLKPGHIVTIKEECNPVAEFNNEIICMDMLSFDNTKIVGIADACNALELYVLYIGFLIAYPSSLKRIIIFSIIGIAIIYVANVIRLLLLAEMNMQQMKAKDIAHHYVFKIIVYGITFGLWVLYVRNTSKKNEAVK